MMMTAAKSLHLLPNQNQSPHLHLHPLPLQRSAVSKVTVHLVIAVEVVSVTNVGLKGE